MYRIEAGRIVEVWMTADNLHLLDQIRSQRRKPAGGGRPAADPFPLIGLR